MKSISEHPSPEYLRKRLLYEPDTGHLYWRSIPEITHVHRRWNTRHAGKRAGCLGGGYWNVRLDDVLYRAHRLIYAMVTGRYPTDLIDHRSGDGTDNRWDQLRVATESENHYNARLYRSNTSGCKGVSWHKYSGRWMVRINAGNKSYFLGLYDTLEEAIARRRQAEPIYHGEFARAC